jgi:hypothetical protein
MKSVDSRIPAGKIGSGRIRDLIVRRIVSLVGVPNEHVMGIVEPVIHLCRK